MFGDAALDLFFLYEARKTAGGICGATAPSAFNLFGDSDSEPQNEATGGGFSDLQTANRDRFMDEE